MSSQRASVLVVGAGIAGLTAAHVLKGHGIPVRVLEATRRVGGRMTSELAAGHVVDCGTQFLSGEYRVIARLLAELGMSERLREASGYGAIVRDGRARVMRSGHAIDAWTSGLLRLRAWLRLARRTLPLAGPLLRRSLSDYSQWADLDTGSTSAWADREIASEVTEYFYEPMLEGLYFRGPEETSRALALVATAFGARRAKILSLDGGLGSLPQELARGLEVSFETPVRSVQVLQGGVRVESSAGALEADRVILAVPAPVACTLVAEPAEDVSRRLLATPYAATINVACITDDGFRLPAHLARVYGLLIPRKERRCIAAVAVESNKSPRKRVAGSQVLNLLFCHEWATRLMPAADNEIVDHALRSVDDLLPSLAAHVGTTRVHRWPFAEPASPVGRAVDLARYRAQCAAAPPRTVLAGDYMGMPFTEGAAESGAWAATLLAASARR